MNTSGEHRTARERTTLALERMVADLSNLEAMGLIVASDRRAAIKAPLIRNGRRA
jgi:hypothetical protein